MRSSRTGPRKVEIKDHAIKSVRLTDWYKEHCEIELVDYRAFRRKARKAGVLQPRPMWSGFRYVVPASALGTLERLGKDQRGKHRWDGLPQYAGSISPRQAAADLHHDQSKFSRKANLVDIRWSKDESGRVLLNRADLGLPRGSADPP